MPTILLLGPSCSGKATIARYLVESEGYTLVRISTTGQDTSSSTLTFSTPAEFLDHATLHWRERFVTYDLRRGREELDGFVKRPWTLLVGCEAGVSWRWRKRNGMAHSKDGEEREMTFEKFVKRDDEEMFGTSAIPSDHDPFLETNGITQGHASSNHRDIQTIHLPNGSSSTTQLTLPPPPSPELVLRPISHLTLSEKRSSPSSSIGQEPLAPLLRMCNLHIQTSDFANVQELYKFLKKLDLSKEDRMRPGWDKYFMTLAGLASLRSNCMKRRVGAVLVSNKRVISTGYNGTPRGMTNCNQGGCARCNSTTVSSSKAKNGTNGQAAGPVKSGVALDECLCLHAEENALLEAGRERAGNGGGGVIYCNTCPCLRCSVKIVQMGISEVVYSQSYSMDEASARIFKEANVIMRQIELAE